MSVFTVITNLVLRIWLSVPPLIVHNLAKARVLQMLFWQQNIESVQGDYVEFGVANGNSLYSALVASKRANSKRLKIDTSPRHFHGFDTFDGFVSSSIQDSHSVWRGRAFSFPHSKVSKRFKSYDCIHLYQMDAEQLKSDFLPTKLSEKVSIVLFDMDLYAPTKAALNWIAPRLQQGTFLVFDEYFGFKGNTHRGEALALYEFLNEHPHLSLRQQVTYGSGGAVFIVSDV